MYDGGGASLVDARTYEHTVRQLKRVAFVKPNGVTESRDVHKHVSGTPQAGSRDQVTATAFITSATLC